MRGFVVAGAMLAVATLVACRGTDAHPRPSGAVSASAARVIRAAFEKSSVSGVRFAVDPDLLSRDAKMARLLSTIGYATTNARSANRFAFTSTAVAASEAHCADPSLAGRSFEIARMRLGQLRMTDNVHDGFGGLRAIEVVFDAHASPLGKLGSALARSGMLSCLDHSGAHPWLGTSTSALVVAEAGFPGFTNSAEQSAILSSLEQSTVSPDVVCPLNPGDVAGAETDLRSATIGGIQ